MKMRKSQVISLIILLVLVTVTIWVGAFYNGKDDGGDELLPTATDTTAPPEVTPGAHGEHYYYRRRNCSAFYGSDYLGALLLLTAL